MMEPWNYFWIVCAGISHSWEESTFGYDIRQKLQCLGIFDVPTLTKPLRSTKNITEKCNSLGMKMKSENSTAYSYYPSVIPKNYINYDIPQNLISGCEIEHFEGKDGFKKALRTFPKDEAILIISDIQRNMSLYSEDGGICNVIESERGRRPLCYGFKRLNASDNQILQWMSSSEDCVASKQQPVPKEFYKPDLFATQAVCRGFEFYFVLFLCHKDVNLCWQANACTRACAKLAVVDLGPK